MATAVLKAYKLNALPGTLEANALYFISHPTNASLFEFYATDSAGTASRHVINGSEIDTKIATAVAAAGQAKIVADIAARNALAPTSVVQAYVKDATGDTTVTAGAALYIYDPGTSAWSKIAEFESMDVTGHTHSNKTTLDKLTADVSGNLLYDGDPVMQWAGTVGW